MDIYILPQLRLATASRHGIKLVLNRSLVWMFSLPMPSFSYLSYCCNNWSPVGHNILFF